MNTEGEVDILLVEDNPDDLELTLHALRREHLANNIFAVRDGEEALEFLFCTGRFKDRNFDHPPRLVLLDLKMPKMDGFEVLQHVRQHKNFRALRIIVLTSSEDIFDVNKAYELGANSFLVKPLEFENLSAMMRTLSSFWLHQSRAPVLERPHRKKNGSGQHAEGADR